MIGPAAHTCRLPLIGHVGPWCETIDHQRCLSWQGPAFLVR